MRSILSAALGVIGSLGFMTLALAETPVAVVEDVKGKPSGVEFMDYVVPGKVIRLGPNDSIVLGYLASCWRETITGGTMARATASQRRQPTCSPRKSADSGTTHSGVV